MVANFVVFVVAEWCGISLWPA